MVLAGSGVAEGAPARAVIELAFYKLRTNRDNEMQRTSDFLSKGLQPALERAGVKHAGYFASVIAEESPFIVSATQFPDVAAWDAWSAKAGQDPQYKKAFESYTGGSGLGYERMETSLLRCFSTVPGMEVPAAAEKAGGRVFELRQYESNNAGTLERKIRMFNEGEVGIFRKLGMRPVFFGETIVGNKMPNLVYMLAFDSLAARESAWSAFGGDPEWNAMRTKPGNSDAELVSNISNSILRGLAFSEIK